LPNYRQIDANQDVTMDRVNPILARKLGMTLPDAESAVAKDAPASPMRQMRRALGRAADKAVGLSASVLGIAEDNLDAESMIETGPEGWIVLGLRGAGTAGLTGLFLIDPSLRSALVEMQTMGNLLPATDQERAVTGTDAVMCVPFADQLMKQLAEAGFCAGELEPASYDMGPIENLRTAGLVMTPGQYRTWRITVQLGGGDRQGEIMIAMRSEVAASLEVGSSAQDWSTNLRRVLEDAPAEMAAVLTKMTLPISKIEEFEVGQVVQLAGTTVGSVTLVGPDGKAVATARLGQVAGKRAVRIEPVQIQLQDDVPKPHAAPGAMMDTKLDGVSDLVES
jgi:flagellar motor switch protein FliM